MQLKIFLLGLCCIVFSSVYSQTHQQDSAQVAQTLIQLAAICKNVDFNDPKSFELGYFYKAAPYVVYRGDDKSRAWKTVSNYKNELEKNGVDAICERINQTVNQDSKYKIVQYFTENESEGTWHILIVTYYRKGIEKSSAFAFLHIENNFALGDID